MKAVAVIAMLFLGTAGLLMTACGVFFLQAGAIGLIGIIPGAAFCVSAWFIFRKLGRGDSLPPSSPQASESQADVGASAAQPDRSGNAEKKDSP